MSKKIDLIERLRTGVEIFKGGIFEEQVGTIVAVVKGTVTVRGLATAKILATVDLGAGVLGLVVHKTTSGCLVLTLDDETRLKVGETVRLSSVVLPLPTVE